MGVAGTRGRCERVLASLIVLEIELAKTGTLLRLQLYWYKL
jgi:hypothetical protein